MIKYALIIFSFFTLGLQASKACVLNSYPQIIKLNKVLDDSIIQKTNCDESTQTLFIEIISGATGELRASHLSQILKSEFNKNVEVTPELIKIEDVKETLTKLIQIPENLSLSKTSSLYSKASLNLQSDTSLKAICNACETAGEKNIKVLVNNRTIWFSAQILTRREGFVTINSLSPYSKKLTQNQFRKTYFYDKGTSHLFSDIENIRFYKPTRQLEKGRVLKISDLTPLTIVKPGQKVKVILKGKNISLNSTALSRQSGRIGDYIQVYNSKTNKKINGQVVGFNTVLVEL